MYDTCMQCRNIGACISAYNAHRSVHSTFTFVLLYSIYFYIMFYPIMFYMYSIAMYSSCNLIAPLCLVHYLFILSIACCIVKIVMPYIHCRYCAFKNETHYESLNALLAILHCIILCFTLFLNHYVFCTICIF